MILITAGVIYFSGATCGADLLDTIFSFSMIGSKSHHHTKLPIEIKLGIDSVTDRQPAPSPVNR
jgi:hypothetical protein